MRISRSRAFKVNLGNYESIDFHCSVTLEHGDLGYTDEERAMLCAAKGGRAKLTAELTDACLEIVNEQLTSEIRDARDLTEEDRSFLLRTVRDQRTTRRPRTRDRS